jgi:hypothetical protein
MEQAYVAVSSLRFFCFRAGPRYDARKTAGRETLIATLKADAKPRRDEHRFYEPACLLFNKDLSAQELLIVLCSQAANEQGHQKEDCHGGGDHAADDDAG